MRYHFGRGGIISISLKPETMKALARGLIFLQQHGTYGLSDMIDGNSQQSQTTHTDSSARIKTGAKDREGKPCAVSPAPCGTRDTASRGIPRDPARTFLRDGAGAGLFDFFAGRERDPAEQ